MNSDTPSLTQKARMSTVTHDVICIYQSTLTSEQGELQLFPIVALSEQEFPHLSE